MAKKEEDDRDIFEKALEQPGAQTLLGAALFGLAGRGIGKLARRVNGIRKPTRYEALKNPKDATLRKEADKIDNIFTAYGVAKGGLVGAIGPDPRRGQLNRRKDWLEQQQKKRRK